MRQCPQCTPHPHRPPLPQGSSISDSPRVHSPHQLSPPPRQCQRAHLRCVPLPPQPPCAPNIILRISSLHISTFRVQPPPTSPTRFPRDRYRCTHQPPQQPPLPLRIWIRQKNQPPHFSVPHFSLPHLPPPPTEPAFPRARLRYAPQPPQKPSLPLGTRIRPISSLYISAFRICHLPRARPEPNLESPNLQPPQFHLPDFDLPPPSSTPTFPRACASCSRRRAPLPQRNSILRISSLPISICSTPFVLRHWRRRSHLHVMHASAAATAAASPSLERPHATRRDPRLQR